MIRKTFLSPEALEETLLIEAGDEVEDESKEIENLQHSLYH